MTVQELIDELQKVEDKTLEVFANDSEFGEDTICYVKILGRGVELIF